MLILAVMMILASFTYTYVLSPTCFPYEDDIARAIADAVYAGTPCPSLVSTCCRNRLKGQDTSSMLNPRFLTAGCARCSFRRQGGRTINWFGLLPTLFPGIMSESDEDIDAVTSLIRSYFLYYFLVPPISGFARSVYVALILPQAPMVTLIINAIY